MPDFPTGLPDIPDADGAAPLATMHTSVSHSTGMNRAIANILALATKLGIGSSPPAANTVLRGTGSGTSAYGQVVNADVASAAAIDIQKLQHVGANNILRSNGTYNVGGQVATADIAANNVSQAFFQNSGGSYSSGGTGGWASTGNNLSLTGLTVGSPIQFWYTGTAVHSVAGGAQNIGLALDVVGAILATVYVQAPAGSYYVQMALCGQFTATAASHTLLEVANVSAATFLRAAGPNIMALELKR